MGRRALGDIVVQVVGRLANGVLGVVVLVLVARALGADVFGRWTTLMTVVSLAGPLTEVGITQVAIARAAAHPQEEPSWIGALTAVRTVLAVATAVLCVVAVELLADGTNMRVAGFVLTGTVLLAGVSSLAVVFQLRMRNDLSIVVLTVNSVVWTLAVAGTAIAQGGLVAFAVAFLGAALISVSLQTVLAARQMRVSFVGWRTRGRELVRVGMPLSISTVMIVAYVKADQIIVFSVAGQHAAGLYGAAYRILDQAIVIPVSVTTTLYPLLVRAHASDPPRVRFVLQRALEALCALSLGAIAFAIPCGGDALALLFGAGFRDAGPTLAILMGVLLLTSLNYLNGSLVLILGLQKRALVFAAAGLVTNLGLNLLLVPRYGYIASAWVTLATELVVVVLTSRATLAGLKWRPETAVLMRAVAAAALTCLGLTALQLAGVPIVALLVLAPLIHGGLLVLLRGLRVAETVRLVRPGARG